jgi:hypothetical protein
MEKITEWKPIACRLRKMLKMKREDDAKRECKVIKMYHWKSELKIGKKRNGSSSSSKLIQSWRREE